MSRQQKSLRILAGLLVLVQLWMPHVAGALPQGGQVAGGQATIQQASPQTLHIQQGSDRAILNWRQYSIASGETVQYFQPSVNSVALNRVIGGDPSVILGKLLANGRIFLLNPNGILFGAGAVVNVGGLLATTLRIQDSDFMAGRYTFAQDPTSALKTVINKGEIHVSDHGFVALVAPGVANEGLIVANLGTVVLGSGERLVLDLMGDGLINYAISGKVLEQVKGPDGTPLSSAVRNAGIIQADGGKVIMEAKASNDIFASVVNQSGVVRARSLVNRGGVVKLIGGDEALTVATEAGAMRPAGEVSGIVSNTGTIDVSAAEAGAASGSVLLMGERVGQLGLIDARGAEQARGGDVVITSTQRTVLGSQSVTDVSGVGNSSAGSVRVWSDHDTYFRSGATILAMGGSTGGNGGFVEVSGKDNLAFYGSVNTSAAFGLMGTLLLDPTTITILDGAGPGTQDPDLTADNQVLAGNGDIGANTIAEATLEGLAAAANVVLEATGQITLNNLSDNVLNMAQTGAGSLTIRSTMSGGVSFVDSADTIQTAGGAITLQARGTGSLSNIGGLTSSGGAITLEAAAGSTILGPISAGGGAVTVQGAGNQTISGVISGAGTTLTKNGASTLTLSGANTYTGVTTINAGIVDVRTNTALGTVAGATSVANGAAVHINGTGLTIAEPITLIGAGINAGGALRNLANSNTWSGAITLGAGGARINSDAGTLTLSGGITGATQPVTVGGAGNATISGVISTTTGSLTKDGVGTLTLTAANTYTGATAVSGGALTFGGANGSATGSAVTVNAGTILTLDNSGTNNNNRLALGLTMNGGEFVVIGNAAANTAEALGALTLNSGYSTITLIPNAATNTQVTFASLARVAGATALFRGTNLGANTVASLTPNSSNLVFTAAPALSGAGNAGTTTVGIIAGAIGAGGAGGAVSTGTDFVTYNPPLGSINGLRPLVTATEYQTGGAPGANVNYRLIANRTADDTATINSLLLSGGITYDYDSSGGANTLTFTGGSGNILSIGGANSIAPTRVPGGALAFGATGANIFAVTDLTLGANAPVTGTAALSLSGAGVLRENRAVARTGGIFVNSGTLRSGVAGAFASQAVTVRPGGTLDLNGFHNTFASLTLESGQSSGATVSTGAGTLTLGGNVTLNANGSGATGATISGNLALGAANRTFTVADGLAANDLTVSAVISGGAGVGIIKAGAGTLSLSGANTYTGVTTVNAGTLSATNATALGTVAGATTVTAGATLDINNVAIGAEPVTLNGVGVGGNGALTGTGAGASLAGNITMASGSTIGGTGALTLSGVISGGFALTKVGSGTITLSGANTYTGATNVNAGTLSVANASGLGTFAGGTIVASDATLDINNVAIGAEAVTLNGIGNGAVGALTGTGAGASLAGNVTMASDSTIGGTGALTLSGVIGGAFNLTKTGNGTLVLSGADTYGGSTNLIAGTLRSGAANVIPNGSAVAVNAASAWDLNNNNDTIGSLAGTGNVTLGAATLTAGADNTSTTYSGVMSGTGGLTKQGTGTLTLAGANAYTGTTNVNGGTLVLSGGSAIADTGAVVLANVAGVTLDLQTNETIGSLAGGGGTGGNVTLNANTLTTGDATNTTYAGVISGTGGLIKQGTGNFTLTGANTYSGSTNITAGTLSVAANNALGTAAGGTSVQAGGSLSFTGGIIYSTAEPVTLNGGALDNAAGVNSFAGPITLTADSAIMVANLTTLTLSGTVNGGFALTTTAGTGDIILQGTIGGVAPLASMTVVSANSISLPAVTTTGIQSYTGAATLNGDLTTTNSNITFNNAATLGANVLLNVGAGDITFASTVNGAFGLTANSTGTSAFNGAVGGATALVNLTTNAGGTTDLNGGTVTTTGAQTYNDPVVLTADATLTSTGAGAITFGDTVTNALVARNLTVNTAGVTTFNGAVGTGPTRLASLMTDAGGSTVIGGGVVNTTGAQTYNDPVTMMGPTTLSSTGGDLTANAAVDATAGTLTLGTAVANNITFNNVGNDFSTVRVVSGNNVTLQDATALDLGASTVSGTLTVTTNGALTQSGAVTAAGLTTLVAGAANDITLINPGNDFSTVAVTSGNNVSLRDATALDLGASTVSGTFTVTTNGALTQSGALTVTGTTTLTAGAANDITLTNASNNFSTVAVASGNNVTLTDATALDLEASTVSGALSVTTNGAVTQSGTLAVTGLTTLAAGAANDITLTNPANTFSTVGITSGNNVSLRDATALDLGASTVSGALALTTGGALTQSGALTVAGTTSVTATAANTDILLASQANDLTGAVSFGGTLANFRDLALRNVNAGATVPALVGLTNLRNLTLTFNNAAVALPTFTLTAGGNLDVTAGGAISQTGAIVVPGATMLTAGAANDITLTNAGNDFTGAVAVGSGNNVALRDATALDLGPSTVSGTFTVTTNGALTQSGALAVTGTTTLAAGAANDITLTNASNNFSTVAVASGNNVTLTDATALDLGAATIAGTLSVTAGGLISQSGALAVAGAASFDTTAAATLGSVTLTNGSALTLNTSTVGGNLTVTTAAGDLTLPGGQTLTVVGDATLTAAGTVNLLGTTRIGGTQSATGGTGSLFVLTADTNLNALALPATGNITVQLTGTQATFAGPPLLPAAVTLANAGNSFGGPVSVTTAAPALTGTVTNTYNLTQSAAVSLNPGQGLTATDLGGTAGTRGNITLPNAGNSFNTVTFTGGDIAWQEANAVTIGGVSANAGATSTGALTITANGPLTQTGAVTAAGLTTLTAGAANDITLTNAGNDFSTVAVTSGNNVALRDATALDLGASTVAGTFTVTTTGALTVNGATVGGNLALTGNSITLASAPLSVTAGNIMLNAATTFMQNVNLATGGAGSIDVTTTTGAITMAPAAVTTSGTGAINYTAGTDAVLGALSTGGPVNVTAQGGSILSAGGGATHVTAGANSTLQALGGVVGTSAMPITVNVSPGTLGVAATMQIGGFSGVLTGTVVPSNTLTLLNVPPGCVSFNGACVTPASTNIPLSLLTRGTMVYLNPDVIVPTDYQDPSRSVTIPRLTSVYVPMRLLAPSDVTISGGGVRQGTVQSLTVEPVSTEPEQADTQPITSLSDSSGAPIPEISAQEETIVSAVPEQATRQLESRPVGQPPVDLIRLNRSVAQPVSQIEFKSGQGDTGLSGRELLKQVSEILRSVSDIRIQIAGHTDNVPIGPKLRSVYPSNQELAEARAVSAVRVLVEEGGIDPAVLSSVGHADSRPIASNATAAGRNKNRRIEIVLTPNNRSDAASPPPADQLGR